MFSEDLIQRLPMLLTERIFGQPEAIDVICNAIITHTILPSEGSLNFCIMGAIGTGKTYIGKVMANLLYGGEESLIRIHGYNNHYQIALGPPTLRNLALKDLESLRYNPKQIVLIEDFQSLSLAGLNLLKGALDHGLLNTGDGEVIDCSQTIFIFTSRVGAEHINASPVDRLTVQTQEAVLQSLRLELLPSTIGNSIDHCIVLSKLTQEACFSMTELCMAKRTLASGKRLHFDLSARATMHLSQRLYSTGTGGRRLENILLDKIFDQVRELNDRNEIMNGDTIRVLYNVANDSLALRVDRG